jgi:hypothetical protein
MKTPAILSLFILLTISLSVNAQTLRNMPGSLDKQTLWTDKELIRPADLMSILKNPNARQPLILNIGVVEDIQSAKHIGAANKQENLNKLEENLKNLPKDTFLVIYCGCCPFDRCPNIRPAFSLMKKMGFTRGRLLDIPVNLKQDWIDKGYPVSERK